MTANLRLGRIAGIEISLNWSVLVLFVLLDLQRVLEATPDNGAS
jgi:hypothetical protein